MYSTHFLCYIAIHKRCIITIEEEEENASILEYLLFHKEHKYEVPIYEIEGRTTLDVIILNLQVLRQQQNYFHKDLVVYMQTESLLMCIHHQDQYPDQLKNWNQSFLRMLSASD